MLRARGPAARARTRSAHSGAAQSLGRDPRTLTLSALPLSVLTACFTKTLHASFSCHASHSHSHAGELGGAKAGPEPESGTLCEDVLFVSTEPQMAWESTRTLHRDRSAQALRQLGHRDNAGHRSQGSQRAGQRPAPRLQPIPMTREHRAKAAAGRARVPEPRACLAAACLQEEGTGPARCLSAAPSHAGRDGTRALVWARQLKVTKGEDC